jgi:hypothetical protein
VSLSRRPGERFSRFRCLTHVLWSGRAAQSKAPSRHNPVDHRERPMRFGEFVDSVIQDLRYIARGLMRRPAFTTVAVLTLAIGVSRVARCCGRIPRSTCFRDAQRVFRDLAVYAIARGCAADRGPNRRTRKRTRWTLCGPCVDPGRFGPKLRQCLPPLLLASKRRHRIDPHGSARRREAGDQRRQQQNPRNGQHCRGIRRRDFKE